MGFSDPATLMSESGTPGRRRGSLPNLNDPNEEINSTYRSIYGGPAGASVASWTSKSTGPTSPDSSQQSTAFGSSSRQHSGAFSHPPDSPAGTPNTFSTETSALVPGSSGGAEYYSAASALRGSSLSRLSSDAGYGSPATTVASLASRMQDVALSPATSGAVSSPVARMSDSAVVSKAEAAIQAARQQLKVSMGKAAPSAPNAATAQPPLVAASPYNAPATEPPQQLEVSEAACSPEQVAAVHPADQDVAATATDARMDAVRGNEIVCAAHAANIEQEVQLQAPVAASLEPRAHEVASTPQPTTSASPSDVEPPVDLQPAPAVFATSTAPVPHVPRQPDPPVAPPSMATVATPPTVDSEAVHAACHRAASYVSTLTTGNAQAQLGAAESLLRSLQEHGDPVRLAAHQAGGSHMLQQTLLTSKQERLRDACAAALAEVCQLSAALAEVADGAGVTARTVGATCQGVVLGKDAHTRLFVSLMKADTEEVKVSATFFLSFRLFTRHQTSRLLTHLDAPHAGCLRPQQGRAPLRRCACPRAPQRPWIQDSGVDCLGCTVRRRSRPQPEEAGVERGTPSAGQSHAASLRCSTRGACMLVAPSFERFGAGWALCRYLVHPWRA